ncbi:MAG TPA: peptidoglycan-binding domain-containing protein, partial [Myxococcales bacterium]|nr:peptidoglycan-binding domain-containing protein [Myxococcales bacterium]
MAAPATSRAAPMSFDDGFDDDPDAAGSPPADDWDSDAPPLEDDGTDPEDPGDGSGTCNGTDSPPGPGMDGPGGCHPPLKKGDSGPDVERLQRRLKDLGYLCDEPDGQFGPKTEEA